MWLVKIDSVGTKTWDKRFGGNWVEIAFGYIRQTFDNGYIVGCASYSNQSGDKSENNFGYEQSWLIKTDSNGTKQWDKTLYVDGEDEYAYPIQSKDSCFVIANYSSGDSSGYKTENSRGNYDFWFVKICETDQPQLPVANFTPSFTELCAGGCFDFTNTSFNASSFEWSFPGAVPASSNVAFPTGICYPDSGLYSVTLIASNTDGSDTIVYNDVIHLTPLPEFDIIEVADTLVAPQGFTFYQWYYNNSPIASANTYYTVALQNGNYSVTVIDSGGCPGFDTLYSFNVAINEFAFNGNVITVYPNPSSDQINISGLGLVAGGSLIIRDILGKEVLLDNISTEQLHLEISSLRAGIYFIEAFKGHEKYFARFVKK